MVYSESRSVVYQFDISGAQQLGRDIPQRPRIWLLHVSEPPASVEFDKFQEGDIITFKEGMPREVSCTAFHSLPVAEINFKVGQKAQKRSKPKFEVSGFK